MRTPSIRAALGGIALFGLGYATSLVAQGSNDSPQRVEVRRDSAATPSTGTPLSKTATTTGATGVTIAANNSALYFAPNVWTAYSTDRKAFNAGAYVKFNFTGTSIALNTTALTGLTNVGPHIRAYIDDIPFDFTLSNTTTQYNIATSLASGTHTFELHIVSSYPSSGSMWDLTNSLKIAGFALDAGASVSAYTPRSKTMMFFGDSLIEGAFTHDNTYATGSDATAGFVNPIAKALDAEYGQVGNGGTGYTSSGNAGVPGFNTSYSWTASGYTRLADGLFIKQPDYIFVMLGTNGTTAQGDVTTAIANLRSAAPSAWIFMVVTPSGIARSAITAAVASASDAKVVTLDTGTAYQYGLSGVVNAYENSPPHWSELEHALLGAKFMQMIAVATGSYSSATITSAVRLGSVAALSNGQAVPLI